MSNNKILNFVKNNSTLFTVLLGIVVNAMLAVIIGFSLNSFLIDIQSKTSSEIFDSKPIQELQQRYSDYKNGYGDEKIDDIKEDTIKHFEELEKDKKIKDLYNDKENEVLTYSVGKIRACYFYGEEKDDTFQNSVGNSERESNSKGNNKNEKRALILNSFSEDNLSDGVTFSKVESVKEHTIKELENNDFFVQTIDSPTVKDYKEKLSNNKHILIMAHGSLIDVGWGKKDFFINLDERSTKEKDKDYKKYLSNNTLYHSGGNSLEKSYMLSSKFIEKYYKNSLNDSIVSCCSCYSTSEDKMSNAFSKAGVSAYTGYSDSVNGVYSLETYETFLDEMLNGMTAQEAYDKSCIRNGKKCPKKPYAKFELKGNNKDIKLIDKSENDGTDEEDDEDNRENVKDVEEKETTTSVESKKTTATQSKTTTEQEKSTTKNNKNITKKHKPTNSDVAKAYQKIINNTDKKMKSKFHELYYDDELYNNSNYYHIFDINKDGISELIVRTATCEQDSKYEFYTYSSSKAIKIGSRSAIHSDLYIAEYDAAYDYSEKAVYQFSRFNGCDDLHKISINNNKLHIKMLYENKPYDNNKVGYLKLENVPFYINVSNFDYLAD